MCHAAGEVALRDVVGLDLGIFGVFSSLNDFERRMGENEKGAASQMLPQVEPKGKGVWFALM